MTNFQFQQQLQKKYGKEIIIITSTKDGYFCTRLNGGNAKMDVKGQKTKYYKTIKSLQKHSNTYNQASQNCPVLVVSPRGTDMADAVVQKIK